MAEPTPFSPDELDRIEDALEGLEQLDAFDDPSSEVRDVLSAYQEILVTTRAALPLQDVPGGALAAVFAEAHASVDAAPAVVAEQTPAAPRGFFERLRKSFLVPSLALAGTAGLVLWMARPQDAPSAMDSPVATATAPAAAKADRAEEKTITADMDKESDEAPALADPQASPSDAAGVAAPAAPPAAAPPPPPEPKPEPEPEPEIEPAEISEKRDKADDLGVPKNVTPLVDEAPAWRLIERADRARGDGDCAAARQDYSVATEDDDAAVRARAYAGIGLCNIQAGDDAGAEDQFERARSQDPVVDKYIQAERNPGGSYRPSPKRKRKSTSKKSKAKANKKAAAMDQMMEPFK